MTITTTINKPAVPKPFDKIYRLMSDAEFEQQFGIAARPSSCEELSDEDIEFLSYLIGKNEYYIQYLDDKGGFGVVELVKYRFSKPFPAVIYGGSIEELDEELVYECIENVDERSSDNLNREEYVDDNL